MDIYYRQIPTASCPTRNSRRLRERGDSPQRDFLCANERLAGGPAGWPVDIPSLPREVLVDYRNCLESLKPLQELWEASKVAAQNQKIWLVTPDDAGFSTYAALYLWRTLVESGRAPRDWTAHHDWSTHHLQRLSSDNDDDYRRARFEYLLAAYVEAERTRSHIPCPLPLRLRSVFLAACRRRPDILEDGAYKFFQAVQKNIESGGNPFYDSLLEEEEFWPELEILARDAEAYKRDIASSEPMAASFKNKHDQHYRYFAAAWIEEPESFLFPDWAWQDRENSEDNNGFAVVRFIAGGRAVFAIDPGIAAAEIPGGEPNRKCVDCSPLEAELNQCSRLRGGGSWLRAYGEVQDSRYGWWSLREPGKSGDEGNHGHADDQKKALLHICEDGIFASENLMRIENICNKELEKEESVALRSLPLKVCSSGTYQFVSIKLQPEVGSKIPKPAVRVIGETLWKAIRHDSREGVPPDFVDRHRQGTAGMITVWSRFGLAVAFNPEATDAVLLVEQLKEGLRKLAKTTEAFKEDLECRKGKGEGRRINLLPAYAELRSEISQPHGRLLRRLFEETQQADVHAAIVADENLTAIRKVQENVDWLEVLVVAFYTFEFTHTMFGDSSGALKLVLFVALGFGGYFLYRALAFERKNGAREPNVIKRFRMFLGLVLLIGALGLVFGQRLTSSTEDLKQANKRMEEAAKSLEQAAQALKSANQPREVVPQPNPCHSKKRKTQTNR